MPLLTILLPLSRLSSAGILIRKRKMKRWRLPSQVHVPSSLRRAVGGHPIVARLLAQRGILDPKEALAFLDPRQYEPAPPEELPNLSQALSLVRRSISAGERIRVWGDFDADGQTATAVLVVRPTVHNLRKD